MIIIRRQNHSSTASVRPAEYKAAAARMPAMVAANGPDVAEQVARNIGPMVAVPVASFHMNIVVIDDNMPAIFISSKTVVSTRPTVP